MVVEDVVRDLAGFIRVITNREAAKICRNGC